MSKAIVKANKKADSGGSAWSGGRRPSKATNARKTHHGRDAGKDATAGAGMPTAGMSEGEVAAVSMAKLNRCDVDAARQFEDLKLSEKLFLLAPLLRRRSLGFLRELVSTYHAHYMMDGASLAAAARPIRALALKPIEEVLDGLDQDGAVELMLLMARHLGSTDVCVMLGDLRMVEALDDEIADETETYNARYEQLEAEQSAAVDAVQARFTNAA